MCPVPQVIYLLLLDYSKRDVLWDKIKVEVDFCSKWNLGTEMKQGKSLGMVSKKKLPLKSETGLPTASLNLASENFYAIL